MDEKLIINRFNNYIEKKTHFFIEKKWVGISRKNFDDWLNNFDDEFGKYIAYKLLDMLIYYNEVEIEKIIYRLVELIKRDYFANKIILDNLDVSDEMAKKLWTDFLRNACFFPVADGNNPTDSGNYICRVLRKIGISEESFGTAKDLPLKIALGKKHFIFVDDIIGTGSQVIRFWTKRRLFGDKTILNDISKLNEDKNFYYITIAATESGVNKVRRETNNLRIITSELLTEEYNMFSPKCTEWEDEEERKKAEQVIANIKKSKNIHDEHSLNLSILFQHCSPNNTLELFWWPYNLDVWKPLKGRF